MMDFNKEATDVHENCGIANHAFYLAALELGGYSWETIGKVWYAALVDSDFKKASNQTFRGWADLTTLHAEKILGSKGKAIVKQAWTKVGVYNSSEFASELKLNQLTADQKTRIDCSTSQYHSVVVISEDMINNQLEEYYKKVPAMQHIDAAHPNMILSNIKADLLPPRVEINVTADTLDRSTVVYHLRIKKGKVGYHNIPFDVFDRKRDKLVQVDIQGWDIAFEVSLRK